jgi:alpha/beta superfamily hydrolase
MKDLVRIRSDDGLELEAQFDAPDDPGAALVLCHPHPKMGGTMNAPLLEAIVADMNGRGWAVLRFNFRGLGSSEGTSGTGLHEVADATGALAEMRERYEVPVAIAGWSFGGAVAIRAASQDADVVACVGIAPAIAEKPGITAGLPPPAEVAITCPLLIVCGENDELVNPREAEEWTAGAGGRFVQMKGANHFFWAKYDALARTVADFLDEPT